MADRTLDTKPSEEATYSNQREFGIIAGRTHVEISPKYGGDFAPGDIIRLEIPAQAYLDPNEFYIHFRTGIIAGAAGTNAHGVASATAENQLTKISDTASSGVGEHRDKTVQFVSGIQSIFNRVRLLAGSIVLEDIQDYNVLYRMLMDSTTSKEWRAGDGAIMEGVYDPENYEQRVANANFHASFSVNGEANQGHFYTVRPLFGLFTAGKYIPLKYMGQLTIELYLEQPQECLWSTSSIVNAPADGTARAFFDAVTPVTEKPSKDMTASFTLATKKHLPFCNSTLFDVSTDFPNATYRVHDVRMHVPFVHPIESYDQALMRQIEQGDISIHHSSWSTHTRQIPSTSRVTLSFQERALSLKGALACMRNSPDIRQIDSDFVFPANGIQAYQWKIGSEYIPAQEISCKFGANRALIELRKGLGTYGDDQMLSYITEENFLPHDLPHQLDTFNASEIRRGASQPSSFFMALDLERSKGQQSGFDSAASSVDIELILNLSNHAKMVGTNDGTTPNLFKNAVAGATWQPSKKRLRNSQLSKVAQSVATTGATGTYAPNDTIASVHYPLYDRPEGYMQDKNVKYSFTAALPVDGTTYGALTYATSDSGVYSRVYLFAHIDQVLRLSAIGRMEIVR